MVLEEWISPKQEMQRSLPPTPLPGRVLILVPPQGKGH